MEFSKTWVNGGEIPSPALASSYLDSIRSGTKTIDETHIIKGSDPRILSQSGFLVSNNELPLGSISASRNTVNGIPLPDIDYFHNIEDGLILSFSNSFNPDIGRMLGNKEVCIRILDMEALQKSFDQQLGNKSTMKECNYVGNHIRDHFTKNTADAWQDEYRLFWPIHRGKKLLVPKGTAEFVTNISPLSRLDSCPCLSGKRFKHCHG